jgi:hypothetical protein
MALPTMITVNGTLLKVDGTPAKGHIVFRTSVAGLSSGTDTVVIPSYKYVALDAVTGAFSVSLPATNDPAWNPSTWEYEVFVDTSEYDYSFRTIVPYDAVGGEIGFSHLLPALDSDSQLYAPYNHTHPGGGSGAVDSVFGRTGVVVAQTGDYTKAQVGLSNVDNTSDANKPVSTAVSTALAGKEATGVASSLVSAHEADTTSVHGIADTANLATKSYVDSAVGGITYPVTSVAGRTGTVVLTKTDVGLGNVDNTSDANKPVSSATTTQLNLKAPLASPTFTGTVSGITKSMVGLGNVDNTADSAKTFTISQTTGLQAALDAKATVTSVTAVSDRVTAVEDMTPVVMSWNGSAYVEDSDARVYVGPSDPGSVPDGSIWIEAS